MMVYLFDSNISETLGYEEFVVLVKCSIEGLCFLSEANTPVSVSNVLTMVKKKKFGFEVTEEMSITD